MKVQIFKDGDKFSARAENGTNILATLSESMADFKARITQQIDDQFLEEADFEEVTAKSLKKLPSDELEEMLPDHPKTAVDMVKAILEARKAAKQPAKRKVTPKADKSEAPKADKSEAAKKDSKPPAKKVVKKKKLNTSAESEKARKKALKNVGKFVTFEEHGTNEVLEGQIRSVNVDKRANMVVYKIAIPGGIIRSKRVNSPTLKIDEAKTQAHLKALAVKDAEKKALEKKLADIKNERKLAREQEKKLREKAQAARKKAKEVAAKEKVKRAKEAAKEKVERYKAHLARVKEKAQASIITAEVKLKEAQAAVKAMK